MSELRYREIIGLHSVGLTLEKVAFLCGCSDEKVSAVSRRAKELGLGWPVPVELSDEELARLVDPKNRSRKALPDFPAIQDELGRKLEKGDADEAYSIYANMVGKADAYIPKTFGQMLRAWLKERDRAPKMLINWTPAEEVQVDWAGRKLALYSADDPVTPVDLFVATLPYSDLTFIHASLDMGMQSWLEHHRALFSYLGGVPLFVAPDNLLTGVLFNSKGRRCVHPKYAEMAAHYGATVLPARVRRPKDKAAVEGHVRIMANRIVGVLEQMCFTSIDQMNAAIAELLEVFNDRPVARFQWRSRRQIFEAEERTCLQELPTEEFVPSTWRKVRASFDGAVSVRGNYYAVPSGYEGAKLQVRVTVGEVEVWTRNKRQCLARHVRREDGAETFEGLPGVHPDRFKPLDQWCHEHGRLKILEQWDVEANGGKQPGDYVCRSAKPAHWCCPDCGFTWEEAPVRRTTRSFDDCLACADIALVPGKNDLATVRPDLAAEWSSKNPMPASAVFPDFCQQVWWLGACGHEWRAPIAKRVGSHDDALCPYCSGRDVLAGFNDVATLCPDLASKFHPTKNRNLVPSNVSVASNRQVYLWDGVMTRVWRESPRKWLTANGYAHVLEPFDALVAEARELDAVEEPRTYGIESGKSSVKWIRFLKEAGMHMLSFEDWCLQFGYEDLLAQWDVERNGNLGPGDVTHSSKRVVWWKGTCGHSWQRTVRMRTYKDTGCPVCGRRALLEGFNSAECLDATLVHLWHPTKNGGLRPEDVSDRTYRMIWFQCPECGLEWSENLRHTGRDNRKCPACHGTKRRFLVKGVNDLASVRPDVAKQLHPELNAGLRPEDVQAHSGRSVWWKGPCGHVWKEQVRTRSARVDNSCPFCANRLLLRGFNDLATRFPNIAAEWDVERNGDVGPNDVRVNSTKTYWWRGSCGHVWDASVELRVQGCGCPYCSGHRALAGFNDLASQYPDLAAEWAYDLNGDLRPDQLVSGSNRSVWWRCEHGHVWQIRPLYRIGGLDRGCPYCGNRKVLAGYNDLCTTHPAIAKQWNSERNGDLHASDVMANSKKRVWWRCEKGHEWQIRVMDRTYKPGHDPGCPYCGNRKVLAGFNDLATTHPEYAAQWHPRLNKPLEPSDVHARTTRKVWWLGLCGHTYDMSVGKRTRAKVSHCPYCSGKRVPERPVKLD